MGEPILIWGAGAMGGTLGAYWARAGIDVLLVDIVPEHVEVCRRKGLRIEGPVGQFAEVIPAVMPAELRGQFQRIVLAVKAHHTAGAVAVLEPYLAENGFVLSLQNGLNEIEISERLGQNRTMGAFVNFGADWLGPGRILFGNRGAVVVGEIDGTTRKRTEEMYELLRVFEPNAILTENIWGYLWGKLAYGAMLFATALNMDSMADNFADPARFPVWRRLGGEVMAVAAERGVTPVGFDGFDPASFLFSSSDVERLKSVADLADFNRRTAKTHSGIWRDLAVRKRRTEIDQQIGVIANLASDVGIETPAIDRLVELVHDIEEGRRTQSLETFEELLTICR
jgi:2-dehydropantoate 2-reductase